MVCWYALGRSRIRIELVTDQSVVASQRGFEAYFAGLTKCDLAARGASSRDEARTAYLSAVMPSANKYMAKIEAAEAGRVGPRMRVVVLDDRLAPGSIEGGWPHTHGELVCMPASYLDSTDLPRLARTLAHERTHVCQRMDPGRCTAPTGGMGKQRIEVTDFDARFPHLAERRRSNPDLDGYLYMDDDGWVVVSLFDSESSAAAGGLGASRVMRVDVSSGRTVPAPGGTYEHPNEAHAYASEVNG